MLAINFDIDSNSIGMIEFFIRKSQHNYLYHRGHSLSTQTICWDKTYMMISIQLIVVLYFLQII